MFSIWEYIDTEKNVKNRENGNSILQKGITKIYKRLGLTGTQQARPHAGDMIMIMLYSFANCTAFQSRTIRSSHLSIICIICMELFTIFGGGGDMQ